MSETYQVIHSTRHSLGEYTYEYDGSLPEVGDEIDLIHVSTGHVKKFDVEYVELYRGKITFKNPNNTIVLKKIY